LIVTVEGLQLKSLPDTSTVVAPDAVVPGGALVVAGAPVVAGALEFAGGVVTFVVMFEEKVIW